MENVCLMSQQLKFLHSSNRIIQLHLKSSKIISDVCIQIMMYLMNVTNNLKKQLVIFDCDLKKKKVSVQLSCLCALNL